MSNATKIKTNLSGKTPRVFTVDPDMRIREELVSLHALNPFIPTVSSARSYMFTAHLSQALVIENGEDKILQSGLETQLAQNTFSKKFDNDVRIVKVIPRYRGLSKDTVTTITEYTILYIDLETGELDYLDIPYSHTLHQYFGFKYKTNTELINAMMPGTILPKDTIVADSPNVYGGNTYRYGINANTALMSIPETAEDGVVISKSMAEKLSYKIFETRVVEFGSDSFPLNIYGDDNEYKPFPEIGELINEDSVLMVLRKYDQELAPALISKDDVKTYNPMFDTAVYVRGPGEVINTKNGLIKSGVVVDIKAYKSPKYKKEVYLGTSDNVNKYVEGLKIYYRDLIDVYNTENREHYKAYKTNIPLSNKLNRLLTDALAKTYDDPSKLDYSSRNEKLDIYRMEFLVEFTVLRVPIGSKSSDPYGFEFI